jgi:hypothetical protein
VREESGALANFEDISVDPADRGPKKTEPDVAQRLITKILKSKAVTRNGDRQMNFVCLCHGRKRKQWSCI